MIQTAVSRPSFLKRRFLQWLLVAAAFTQIALQPLSAQDAARVADDARASLVSTPGHTEAGGSEKSADPLPATQPADRLPPAEPRFPLLPQSTAQKVGSDSERVASLGLYFVLLVSIAGVGLYFLKNGLPLRGPRAGGVRKLEIREMRALGNRQFLLVVEYEEHRMLLGVTPGKIDYLCPLDGPGGSAPFQMPEARKNGEES
jgi:flagellar biogenesis protein FliO